MPWTPNSCRASFTSSNLNGLMMASIFFMGPRTAAPDQAVLAVGATQHGGAGAHKRARERERAGRPSKPRAPEIQAPRDQNPVNAELPSRARFGSLGSPRAMTGRRMKHG